MKMKYGLILFCLIVVLQLPVAFSQTISADQIIVAEPLGERIPADRDLFLTVNIANKQVVTEPLHVVVTRQLSALPFADELNTKPAMSSLRVSLLRLIPYESAEAKKLAVYPLESAGYSEGYTEEIALINRYFEVKGEISALRAEMSELNREFNFEESVRQNTQPDLKKPERATAYSRYQNLKDILKRVQAMHAELESKYARFFEEIVLSQSIDSMSYYQSLGKLGVGNYRVRFLNGDLQLVKELSLEIFAEDSKPQLDSKRLP